jgi:hypothetical protein
MAEHDKEEWHEFTIRVSRTSSETGAHRVEYPSGHTDYWSVAGLEQRGTIPDPPRRPFQPGDEVTVAGFNRSHGVATVLTNEFVNDTNVVYVVLRSGEGSTVVMRVDAVTLVKATDDRRYALGGINPPGEISAP